MENEASEVELRTTGSGLIDRANALAISTDRDYEMAGEFILGVKGFIKRAKEFFKPIKQKIDAAKQEVLDKEKSVIGPAEKAEKIASDKWAAYRQEQERRKRELEAKLQGEAQKLAEEQRLNEAAYVEALGDREGAERMLEQPVEPVPVVLGPSVPKIKGLPARKNWKYRVIDADKVPDEWWILDTTAIGAYVRSRGENAKIPGIAVYAEEVPVGRGAGSGNGG